MPTPATVVALGPATVRPVRGGQGGGGPVGLPGLPQDRRERQRRARAAADAHRRADLPRQAIARTLVNPTAPMPSFTNLPPDKFNALVDVPVPAEVAAALTADPAARSSAGQVRAMFDRIAGFYDVMNSVMTAGLHHRWRRRAVDLAGVGPGEPGARRGHRHRGPGASSWPGASARRRGRRPRDFSEEMLERAREPRRRAIALRVGRRAGARPTPTTSSTRRPSASGRATSPTSTRGLAEMARVVRPGRAGRRPRDHDADQAAAVDVLRPVVRSAGAGARAGGRRSARPTSTCPTRSSASRRPDELAAAMHGVGLRNVRYVLTAGGIIAIHVGEVA